MRIEIENNSGFCFGVVNAVKMAEQELKLDKLYCLGEIVHNPQEVKRLGNMGLETIDYERFKTLRNVRVLIRAHGEPPETYEIARRNNIDLVDATCPVVLKLQQRIKKSFAEMKEKNGHVVIYGKKGHAEVIGLAGQTDNTAIVVSNANDLDSIDMKKPVRLFSQTTMPVKGFEEIKEKIGQRMGMAAGAGSVDYEAKKTICGSVSCREPALKDFAPRHDVILFVGGKNSSNGKMLFNICLENNPRSYFIESAEDIHNAWFHHDSSVGICGATSTPMWLMEEVSQALKNNFPD